jgi:hypothetical protein
MSKKLIQAAAGAGGEPVYVDDVFSTYLYTGTGSSQTITNDIDLSGEGGLVWLKNRDASQSHGLFDTERTNGDSYFLSSDLTGAEYLDNGASMTFNSDGFSLGSATYFGGSGSGNAQDYVSWSFRKQAGFFDVVTYTGNGTTQEISHNLGSTPGLIIVKNTTSSTFWAVYHRSVPDYVGLLNSTSDFSTSNTQNFGNNTNPVAPTDSVFTVGQQSLVNTSGDTYVAYLFAHDDQSFGDDSDESIIKCGSYTGNGNADGPEIDLGWEPQWLMVKRSSGASAWYMLDNMRGMALSGNGNSLYANLSSYENQYWAANFININSTGFQVVNTDTEINASGDTYIYIAIRRPMKTPESGTEVFAADFRGSTEATAAGVVSYSGFPVDLAIQLERTSTSATASFIDRLRDKQWLKPDSTAAETPVVGDFDTMSGWWNGTVSSDTTIMALMFKRATGFFDVVAYTGDGSGAKSFNHNLGVIPELMIVKGRNYTDSWYVYVGSLGSSNRVKLNTDAASGSAGTLWNNTSPTATQFTVGSGLNVSAETNITYLFATLAGVSKVGSYTGTGSNVDVDCGFSAGARFILIKRTDSTGDWYVWDSVRGIVAGNDPYLLLNSTAAEVTSTDYIDPLSSGFTVTSSAPAGLNASGGTYIFLAIA